jgi:hypothetical protein
MTDPALRRADDLLKWLQAQPNKTAQFREILRLGPSQIRTKAAANEALAILADHGWTIEASSRPRAVKAVS